jgi:hypothetical protein
MIAIFDTNGFLIQFITGTLPGYSQKSILPEQEDALKGIQMYDADNKPVYKFDESTGIPCADGFLRETSRDERWDLEVERYQSMKSLNYDVNVFIGARYDQGTKDKINAKYLRLLNKETSKKEILTDEDKAKKAKGESFDEWTDAILIYYYGIKQQILTAVDVESLQAIIWDFDGLFGNNGTNTPDPKVSLASFYGFLIG